MKAKLSLLSTYLPEKVLTNEALSERFLDLEPEVILRRTGVRNRHISAPTEIGSDVGLAAAHLFFEEHTVDKKSIDFLIFCTEYPDHCAPHTASRLAHALDLPSHCGSMDMPMGCTGFMYGMSLAKGMIESGQATNVLFITAETPSKVIHPDDRDLVLLFGDGGTCSLFTGSDGDAGISPVVFGTNGAGYEKLIVRGSGSRETTTREWLDKYDSVGGMPWGRMEMNGPDVFTFALKEVPLLMKTLLERQEVSMEDIDLFVFHQANGYMLKILRKKLRIPEEKFFIYMEETGNTVSSTIPIALQAAIEQGVAKEGHRIALVSFGIGFSWAAALITL